MKERMKKWGKIAALVGLGLGTGAGSEIKIEKMLQEKQAQEEKQKEQQEEAQEKGEREMYKRHYDHELEVTSKELAQLDEKHAELGILLIKPLSEAERKKELFEFFERNREFYDSIIALGDFFGEEIIRQLFNDLTELNEFVNVDRALFNCQKLLERIVIEQRQGK